MSHKLQIPGSQVNTFFHTIRKGTWHSVSYVMEYDELEEYPPHPLISHSLICVPTTSGKKISIAQHEALHRILELYIEHDGKEFLLSRSLLMDQLKCSYKTVGRYLRYFKDRSFISMRVKQRETHITVNILVLYAEFRECLFQDLMSEHFLFLKHKIQEATMNAQLKKVSCI